MLKIEFGLREAFYIGKDIKIVILDFPKHTNEIQKVICGIEAPKDNKIVREMDLTRFYGPEETYDILKRLNRKPKFNNLNK